MSPPFSAGRRRTNRKSTTPPGHGQRAHRGATALYAGGLPLCALSQGHDVLQNRQLHDRGDVSALLNRWIANYVLLDDEAGQESKARYPLRDAEVDVTEIPGKPGAYKATVFLRPHFQLDELTASIRLVAELPAAAA